jgi:hypothetical protein
MAKRNIKAVPQIEATILVEHTSAPLVKCVARAAFKLGNVSVEVGETFFLVKSVRREGRYYVVHFSNERRAWQCSCGANCTKHAHTQSAQLYVVEHVVKPRVAAILSTTEPMEVEARETDDLDNSAESWKKRLQGEKQRKQANAVAYTEKLNAVKQSA